MLLVLAFTACSNDDEKEKTLTKQELYQTSWKGTMNREGTIYNVGFQFLDDNRCSYSVIEENGQPYTAVISYGLEGKIMTFNSVAQIFPLDDANWTVISYTGNKLIMKQYLSNPDSNQQSTMTLQRVN